MKVALVLGGGGAKGLAHIGAIEELEARGYEITSVAGTSMGAVIGGVYALGKLEETKEWFYSLDRLEVFRLIDFTFTRHGLIKGDKVLNKMKEFTQDANIEELNIPYTAIATDIKNGEEVVFNTGDIYDAIRASIAIPTVLTPIRKGSQLLVDGGVLNNLPLNHVKRNEGDILVAIDVTAKIPVPDAFREPKGKKDHASYQQKLADFNNHLKKIWPSNSKKEEELSYFDLMNETLYLMTHKVTQLMTKQYPPDIIIRTSGQACSIFDFYKAEKMVELGRYAAREALDNFEHKS